MTTTCTACEQRGKTWPGSDPKCGFLDGSPFTAENWNCATVSKLRSLVAGDCHVSLEARVHLRYCDDQWFATVDLSEMDAVHGRTLWLSWYKRRGATEAMWILDEYEAPRLPTEADCLAITEALSELQPA